MDGQPRTQHIFAELEQRLARLEPKDPLNVKRDLWVGGVMLLGIAMTLPTIFGVKGELVSWIVLAGLVLELCGFGVFVYRQVRDIAPDFVDAKKKFADELDSKLVEHEELLAWLRSLPLQARGRCIAYVDYRLESMAQRYQIMFGAVDKLGLLPLLAAIFVQIQAIRNVSILTAIFAFTIFALYGMAIWLARFRLQMQRFARLLRMAES